MKVLVIYDSVYGNTQKIASVIAESARQSHEVTLHRVGPDAAAAVAGADYIFVGAPTQAFAPTKPMKVFLAGLPADALKGKRAVAFDTRANLETINSRFFRRIIDGAGYAEKYISQQLRCLGAVLDPSQGFLVDGREGPLTPGELLRAEEWGKKLA
jgi:flavodoxin